MKAFAKINTKDYELSKVQDNIDAVFNQLISIQITDGVQVRGVQINATPTVISHTLTRQPLGWFVTDQTLNMKIWRTEWNSRTITLQADTAGTVDLWVF